MENTMNMYAIAKKASSIAIQCAAVAAITFTIIATSEFLASAGVLTPPGPPAPTMRTLDEQKPSWNKLVPATQRFVDALDGTAVLDKETGLVWAKTPDSIPRNWQTAKDYCTQLNLGGRMGWRLPTIEEINTLVDVANPGAVKLPAGHPFQNIQAGWYWSSTTVVTYPTYAWGIYLNDGSVSNYIFATTGSVWPVRSSVRFR
jgi:hypothetical protein